MIFISLLLYLELQKGTDLGADLKEAIGCQTSSLSYFNIQHFFLKIKVLCPGEIRYIQKVKYGIMTSSN